MSSLKLNNLLVIGNTSTNFPSQTDYKKVSLHGDIYDCLVSYEATDIKKIYDIHKYLMKKTRYFFSIKMFNLIQKVYILILSTISVSGYCLLLKSQEFKVRKVIIDNDYMTFPYKIKVDKCIGSYVIVKIILTIKLVYQIVLKILA